MKAQHSSVDQLHNHLAQIEALVQHVDQTERHSREQLAQLSEHQWQERLASFRAHNTLLEDAFRAVESQLGRQTRQRSNKRRCRKLKKQNRIHHKRLLSDAKAQHNNRVDASCLQLQCNSRVGELQSELDHLNEHDSTLMLNEIALKKNDLIAFGKKLTSLQTYRLAGNSILNSDKNDDSLFANLKHKITKQLLLYNKEELYIRQLFSIDSPYQKLPFKIEKVAASIDNLAFSKKANNFERILQHNLPPLTKSLPVEWNKYVSSSPVPECEPNCSGSSVTATSSWAKYLRSDDNH